MSYTLKFKSQSSKFKVLIFLSLLLACNSGPDALKPLSYEIDGPLNGYYAVADSICTVADDTITLRLIRQKKGLPSPWNKKYRLGYADQTYEMAFSLELTDASGSSIAYKQTDLFRDYNALTAIASLAVGDTAALALPLHSGKASCFRVGSLFKVNLAADRPDKSLKVENPPVPDLQSVGTMSPQPVINDINKEVRAREEAERRAAEERARQEEEARRTEEQITPWDVIRESSRDIYQEASRKMREWLGFDE